MTNQEAIEIINRENNPNDKEVWDTFPEYREALDMAIKASTKTYQRKQKKKQYVMKWCMVFLSI